MSSFDARLLMPGKARLPMNVVVDVSEDRISFMRGDNSLGDWPLRDVVFDLQPDGFHLKLDQEEVVLSVGDPGAFAGALGVAPRIPSRTRSEAPVPMEVAPMRGFVDRLEKNSPQERFSDVRERIDGLRSDLTDASVSPSDAFGRWLDLLKEINLRHGRGHMPTPIFCRFNAELLELVSASTAEEPDEEPVLAQA